jgi:hypothetical protein
MTKKTKRLKRERVNRFLKNIREHGQRRANTILQKRVVKRYEAVEQSPDEPKPVQKPKGRFDQWFDEWLDEASDAKILGVIVLLYGIGSAFYSGILHFGGYPFKEVYGVFFLILIALLLVFLLMRCYRYAAEKTNIFGSSRSWFMRFDDFIANDFETFGRESDEEGLKHNLSWKLAAATFYLPLLGIATGLVYCLLLAVLILDWARLLCIGFANLCFVITPRDAAWAYVLWAIIGGGGFVFFPGDTLTHFFMGFTASSLFGLCVFLCKELCEKKYRTPYFPT